MDVQKVARAARYTVSTGSYRDTARRLARRVASTSHAYGLERDLSVPHTTPTAKVPITVRPMTGEFTGILDEHTAATEAERWERHTRRRLLEAGIGVPYVAVDPDGEPCYVQWLFGAGENPAVREFFHGIFPTLAPDEVLLEGAFTPARHQGRRIMSAAMSQIAALAGDLGAHRVLTFVGTGNVASLKGCERAGFLPTIHRTETRRLSRLRVDFRRLTATESEAARVLKT